MQTTLWFVSISLFLSVVDLYLTGTVGSGRKLFKRTAGEHIAGVGGCGINLAGAGLKKNSPAQTSTGSWWVDLPVF